MYLLYIHKFSNIRYISLKIIDHNNEIMKIKYYLFRIDYSKYIKYFKQPKCNDTVNFYSMSKVTTIFYSID